MNKPSILIVDDEVDIQKTFLSILKANYSVKATGSGYDALALLKKDRYAVILLDIRMPGLDGIETLREIKKRFPLIEVVMLTGHATVETAIEGMKLGAYDYLMKPCDMDVLMTKVREAELTQ